jgi:hypothetical protein
VFATIVFFKIHSQQMSSPFIKFSLIFWLLFEFGQWLKIGEKEERELGACILLAATLLAMI